MNTQHTKEYNAKYHQEHKVAILARKKVYDAANKERRNELARIRRRKASINRFMHD